MAAQAGMEEARRRLPRPAAKREEGLHSSHARSSQDTTTCPAACAPQPVPERRHILMSHDITGSALPLFTLSSKMGEMCEEAVMLC